MSGGKAETLPGPFDLETYVFHIRLQAETIRHRSEEGTQAGKGAELGFKPGAGGESPELRFPTQHKFLAL